MPNSPASRSTGESAVGNERHAFFQTHAGYGRSGHKHFPHPGAAFWPFVAYNHHVARLDLVAEDSLHSQIFAVVNPGFAGKCHHAFIHRCLLHHSAVGSQGPSQDCDTALFVIRLINALDDIRTFHDTRRCYFFCRQAAHRQRIAEFRLKNVHDCGYAAGIFYIFHEMLAAGPYVSDVRRVFTDLVEKLQWNVDASVMGYGRQMKHRIGGAAQRHIYPDSILYGVSVYDIP